MHGWSVIGGALLVLVLARLLLRPLIALLAGPLVARKALERVPDRVKLAPNATWKDPALAAALADPLRVQGFEDGGAFGVDVMPGVVLNLLADSTNSVMGIVYEHPIAGHWVELVTRYRDGGSYSVTTSRDTGLAPRPGHTTVHMPGATPLLALARLLKDRPTGDIAPLWKQELVARFEQGYAESMAWRKQHGVSRAEVLKIATRKVA